jgi:hypothetical protein
MCTFESIMGVRRFNSINKIQKSIERLTFFIINESWGRIVGMDGRIYINPSKDCGQLFSFRRIHNERLFFTTINRSHSFVELLVDAFR